MRSELMPERVYMQDEKVEGLPVKGYQPQTTSAVDTVNANKILEERVLRRIDELQRATRMTKPGDMEPIHDGRWLAIAKTNIELGFMALNRAVFQPKRVELPEDSIPEATPFVLSSDKDAGNDA